MAEITACDVDVVGGNAPGCIDQCEPIGGGGDFCTGLEISNMPTLFSPYSVNSMPSCTDPPCFLPMCNPI